MPSWGRGCAIQLILWAATAAAFFFYVRSLPIAIGLGLLGATATVLAGSAVKAIRERRILLDGTLRDGKWIAVAGNIRSHAPLRAPLSGVDVVAYEYRIERDQRVGKSSSLMTYFDGRALASSVIDTPAGHVRILSVPALEVAAADVGHTVAIANARDHIRRSEFVPRDTAAQRIEAMRREEADDDGVFRVDRKYSATEVDLADGFRFEERHVRQGETVCAFGYYSRERGGLLRDPRWGTPVRISSGTADQAAAALASRIRRYSIGVLVLGSLAIVLAVVSTS